MLHWIMFVAWFILFCSCTIVLAGLALILWDDISAERKYKSRRDL